MVQRFGLIGYPLSHSFSKGYFTQKFEALGVAAVYENIEVESLETIATAIAGFQGLNVTIPHKKTIIAHLDGLSAVARELGAVNVLERRNDQWIGHNTDQYGFEKSLTTGFLKEMPEQALIFGTGGAAASVKFTLKKLGISYFSVSRNPSSDAELSYSDLTSEVLKNSKLLVNTTPLGMHPNVDSCIALPYEMLTTAHFCFDLVYNPAETLFLKKAKMHGAQTKNGLDMLHFQAEKAWEIWNSSTIDANSSL
ncbi:MAG: shikimate dehydrogenase [Schleiferiaceae bacterium]|nr:shikimate dehydrogenase [Schleiferiaceae bacterium]